MRGKRFEVDRANGKIAGVCAGLANTTGLDATIIRIALVVVTLIGAFPWSLILYAVAAFAGQPRRGAAYTPIAGRDEARERMRNMDLRMQAIETYVTSSNSKLAREIEELR